MRPIERRLAALEQSRSDNEVERDAEEFNRRMNALAQNVAVEPPVFSAAENAAMQAHIGGLFSTLQTGKGFA